MAFLTMLLALYGCSDTFDTKGDSSKISLELVLSTPANSVTRSMTETDEYLINDLQVLLFDNGGSLIANLPSEQLKFMEPGNIKKVQITLDESYLGQNVQFMLLANMRDNYTDVLDVTPGRSRDEILSDLKYELPGIWPDDGTRHFPMYGTISLPLTDNLLYETVFMLRSVARVQFWVNKDGNNVGSGLTYHNDATDQEEELFRMSSVRVYYSRKGGYIAPLMSFTNEQRAVTEPSQPEDFEQRGMSDPLIYTLDESDKYMFIRSVYIPENDNITPEDGGKPVNLVVGGHYKGDPKETYYKLEFKNKETDQIFDCLRNHTYDFNITSVTGPGSDTPEGASDSELQVVVTPWEESYLADANMRMYELMVTRSMINVDDKAHDEVVDVTTTYGGTYPNSNHWKYDGPESNVGNDNNWFSVEETETGLVIHISTNSSTTANQGSFTITAGALTKRIFIAQAQLETSNCYMIGEPGLHGLYALNMGVGPYGNSGDDGVLLSQSLNTANPSAYNNDGTINPEVVKSCRLIWQSRPGLITHVGPEGYDTATHPNMSMDEDGNGILTNEGILAYTVGEPLPGETGGNAVIGIFDESGNCIWSWHLWIVWNYDSREHDLHFLTSGVRSGFYFQELNLGAMVNEPDNAASFGLLYQWGRKDPMRSTNDLLPNYSFTPTYGFTGEDTTVRSEYENSNEWHNWSAGTGFGDIITSLQNPMSLASNWGTGSSSSNSLWGNPYGNLQTSESGAANSADPQTARYNGRQVWNEGKKSIYDPCPVGYRVPSINGFYFGMAGMALTVRSKKDPSSYKYIYSYCNLDGVGADSRGYEIYYFGQYKNYEKYYTWMPMTPYYADGNASQLTSPMEGSEGFAYTWLNCTTGGGKNGAGGAGECVGWHPINYHIHEYANFGVDTKNAGTIRCVRETDPDIISVTLPDKVALLADAGSTMDFDVLSNMDYWVEINNLTYDWVTATKGEDGIITVRSTKPNLTAEDREAYIYVCLSNGDKKPVRVIQSGVSIGADEIKVGNNQGDTKSVTFTIPTGGTLSLPITQDDHFTYALSNSGQTYTITVTARNANPSPNDVVEDGFYLNLSDGTNTNQMPIRIVQSKYTIGTGSIIVPYYSEKANERSGSASFVPPGGATPTLYVWNGNSYVAGTEDDRFTYALTSKTDKNVTTYTLTATYKYPNFGSQRKRTVQIDLNGNRFDVDVIQNPGSPMQTTSVTVANNGGDVKLQANKPFVNTPLDGFTWRLLDDESEYWLGLDKGPGSENMNPQTSGFNNKTLTHVESNFPGEARTTTLKIEFTQTATGDVFTIEIPVSQAEGNPFKTGSSIQVNKDANKNIQITWADGWKGLNSNEWSWEITNASAAPSWLNLTVTGGNNVNGQQQINIGTTAEKNQTGRTRMFVAMFEFHKLGPGGNPDPKRDPITIPVTITQSK